LAQASAARAIQERAKRLDEVAKTQTFGEWLKEKAKVDNGSASSTQHCVWYAFSEPKVAETVKLIVLIAVPSVSKN
jgi:hypothetical protein